MGYASYTLNLGQVERIAERVEAASGQLAAASAFLTETSYDRNTAEHITQLVSELMIEATAQVDARIAYADKRVQMQRERIFWLLVVLIAIFLLFRTAFFHYRRFVERRSS